MSVGEPVIVGVLDGVSVGGLATVSVGVGATVSVGTGEMVAVAEGAVVGVAVLVSVGSIVSVAVGMTRVGTIGRSVGALATSMVEPSHPAMKMTNAVQHSTNVIQRRTTWLLPGAK